MNTTLPMSCWAAEDLPTGRAEKNGFDSLSDSELLSIIIGSGTRDMNAIELSRVLLQKYDNKLSLLSKAELENLTISGLGKKKASKILAAFELGKRRFSERKSESPDLATAIRIYNQMMPYMVDLEKEEFWILMMNHNFHLIKKERISQGGFTETIVDVRVIMKECLLNNATLLAVCHNHPSGSIRPSKYDDDITLSIKKACDTMRIHFIDHVIVTDGNYYSYHENGKL